jgi:hypothetical protein
LHFCNYHPVRPIMTPDDFRHLALSLPEAVEVYRWGRSDFRVARKAFANLEGPADSVAVVKLTPEQQSMFRLASPGTFAPVTGNPGWLGCTNVLLASAKAAIVENALSVAWRNVAPKSLLERIDEHAAL